MPSDPPPTALNRTFVRRTLFQVAVAASAFLLWRLSGVLLLIFGAVVVAVLIRALSDPIRDHTPANDKVALAAALLLLAGLIALTGWLFKTVLSAQLADLAGRMPHSMDQVREQVAHLPFGQALADSMPGGQLFQTVQGMAGRLEGYAITAFGAVTNLILVLFTGVFMGIDPALTRDGVLMLLPKGPRNAMADALDASGRALKMWVLGVLVDMLFVGVLTGVGAWLIGLPSPFALGAIAAVLDFVPIVGPIASIVPGVLVAIPLGTERVVWTLVMYTAVQQIEGNLVYPFIQRRAVKIPPALSLMAVLTFGALFGGLGVVLATPLLVVIHTMVRLLYVRNTLGEDVPPPGGAQ